MEFKKRCSNCKNIPIIGLCRFTSDCVMSGKKHWVPVEIPKGAYIPNEFETKVKSITDKLAETLIKKNHDYGDSFKLIYDEYGDISTEIRLMDKLNRFKTLNKAEQKVNDESKEDTLLDMAGYCILRLVQKVKDNE